MAAQCKHHFKERGTSSIDFFKGSFKNEVIVNAPFAINNIIREILFCSDVVKTAVGEVRSEVGEVDVTTIEKRSVVTQCFDVLIEKGKLLRFLGIFYNG